uniref:Uncharacterized protein n=1 Tax=Arundo donax TaxID=35708 RepID=A0A0A9CN37_ARUDO
MLPPDQVDTPSHLSKSKMPPPAPKSMPPPPPPKSMLLPPPPKSMPPPRPRSIPPPPPKFPSNEILSRNENKTFTSQEPMAAPRSLDARSVSPPKFWSAQLPPREPKEEEPKGAPVSDTLLKLMDYGDDDDDDIDATDSIPRGNPSPS